MKETTAEDANEVYDRSSVSLGKVRCIDGSEEDAEEVQREAGNGFRHGDLEGRYYLWQASRVAC